MVMECTSGSGWFFLFNGSWNLVCRNVSTQGKDSLQVHVTD
uniref:Uncharacterized protein n=1 Tax=Aegilops tauschii subsp. strangulata TaxID=200361 RepID=A0A452XAW0_AEGTS